MSAEVVAAVVFLAGLCFVLFLGCIFGDWYDARERRARSEEPPRWR